MIRQTFLRANIPFTFENSSIFNAVFEENSKNLGWSKQKICGDLLLKHINTCLKENVVCFSKKIENLTLQAEIIDSENIPNKKVCTFSVSDINVFCFDTNNGIISLHIPFSSDISEDDLTNLCSSLRCSVRHEKLSNGTTIMSDGKEVFLSDIAETYLSELFENNVTMFKHQNKDSLCRIDIFSCVLSEKCDKKPLDLLSYRLANALDNRDKDLEVCESEFYRPQENSRWCFSKRGSSVIACLCDIQSTNNFLNTRWLDSIKTNYFYLYILVLHQKYAIYNYLDYVATDSQKVFMKSNQESLIDFNSKYIFSIISDETMLQSVYLKMKNVNNVDEVYKDLLDELERMFDYSQLKKDEENTKRNSKFSLISLIISIFCSITLIFDTVNVFANYGSKPGFSSINDLLCTFAIIFEVMFFALCLIFAFSKGKKKK